MRRHPPAKLPTCFRPKLYVCPDPDCGYLGSAADGIYLGDPHCMNCAGSLDETDMFVFGPVGASASGGGEPDA